MNFDLTRFIQLIKSRCGLLFEGSNQTNLAQAVTLRLTRLGVQPDSYYQLLLNDLSEFKELVNLLTINETYFFREPEQLQLLVEYLLPRFLASQDRTGPVRILSAGCASGEEPYSLAMALLDKYGDSLSHLVSLTAVDIDTTVLTKARQGIYSPFSFRGVPEEVRTRHFDTLSTGGYALQKRVKQLVNFYEFNLLESPAPPFLQQFDLILFRNVSIYFDQPTRQQILRNLAEMMTKQAILIIGMVETLANDLGIFALQQEEHLFYFRKHTPEHEHPSSPVQPIPLATPPPRPSLEAELKILRQLTQEHAYDQALPRLDALLTLAPDNTVARLLKAHILINRKEFAAAAQLVQPIIAANPEQTDALLLLGLAARWQQQYAASILNFKQVVYLMHDCWPAHYHLAELYRINGETERARRSYRTVLQLLSGTLTEPAMQTVPLDLPMHDVRFLCEHHLARLPAGGA